ncbi:MAG: helix-turn-helix transcriptional regulator [Candidatus Treponema excrementipullorum]|nr:helix-turn-helix transcriptional regulator [Candidatus Treponema excrementipullorum]MDY4708430.1 helix-turn-helix transcriptional regulator [Candidatus Treponema excrementipullorum]
MKKLTEYGKALRKIRLDNNELLGHMAQKLEISPAMLSYIENGSRSITPGLTDKICEKYRLDEKQRDELYQLESLQPKSTVIVNFTALAAHLEDKTPYMETAFMFARDFTKMSIAQLTEIQNLLKRFESENTGGSCAKYGDG